MQKDENGIFLKQNLLL